MNTYAFITNDSWRIEVKASTPKSAYNKLLSIPHLKRMGITKSYYKYSKDGFAPVWDIRHIN